MPLRTVDRYSNSRLVQPPTTHYQLPPTHPPATTTITGFINRAAEGAAARDELGAYIAAAEADVSKFVEKRDAHFDRLVARGQSPIRLKD